MLNLDNYSNIKEYKINKSKTYSANKILNYIFSITKNDVYDIEDNNIYNNIDDYLKFMDDTEESIGPIYNDESLDIDEIRNLNNQYKNDFTVFKLNVELLKSLYKDYNLDDCKKIQNIIYNE